MQCHAIVLDVITRCAVGGVGRFALVPRRYAARTVEKAVIVKIDVTNRPAAVLAFPGVKTKAGRASVPSQEVPRSPTGGVASASILLGSEGRSSKEHHPSEVSSWAGRAQASSSEVSESPAEFVEAEGRPFAVLASPKAKTVAGRAAVSSQEVPGSPAGSSAQAPTRQGSEGRLPKEQLPIEASSGVSRASASSSEESESPAALDGLPKSQPVPKASECAGNKADM